MIQIVLVIEDSLLAKLFLMNNPIPIILYNKRVMDYSELSVFHLKTEKFTEITNILKYLEYLNTAYPDSFGAIHVNSNTEHPIVNYYGTPTDYGINIDIDIEISY